MRSLSLDDPLNSLSWFVFVVISLHEIQSRLQAFPSSLRDEGSGFRLSVETNPSWLQQQQQQKLTNAKKANSSWEPFVKEEK